MLGLVVARLVHEERVSLQWYAVLTLEIGAVEQNVRVYDIVPTSSIAVMGYWDAGLRELCVRGFVEG